MTSLEQARPHQEKSFRWAVKLHLADGTPFFTNNHRGTTQLFRSREDAVALARNIGVKDLDAAVVAVHVTVEEFDG